MIKLLTTALACMLACALTVEADAASLDRGPLKGRTRQGRKIRLVLRRDSVQIKRLTIELRCRDGSILIDDESGFLPTPLSAGGRIRDHQIGSTDDVWIRGRLAGTTCAAPSASATASAGSAAIRSGCGSTLRPRPGGTS